MIRLIATAVLLAATVASATTYEPCSPVFLAGPQGRPIPNNVVQITNIDGSPVVGGVWNDAAGAQQFQNILPANQVLQVFAIAGIYRVNVSGDGLTKQYQITCGGGYGGDAKKISIDRTADLLLEGDPTAPLICLAGGPPCYRTFSNTERQFVTFDFIMPSFPLSLDELRLSWHSQAGNQVGTLTWDLDYCTYAVGSPVCTPSGAHLVSTNSTATVGAVRVDQIITQDWAWTPNQHVVVKIARPIGGTTLAHAARLENVRLEFKRP